MGRVDAHGRRADHGARRRQRPADPADARDHAGRRARGARRRRRAHPVSGDHRCVERRRRPCPPRRPGGRVAGPPRDRLGAQGRAGPHRAGAARPGRGDGDARTPHRRRQGERGLGEPGRHGARQNSSGRRPRCSPRRRNDRRAGRSRPRRSTRPARPRPTAGPGSRGRCSVSTARRSSPRAPSPCAASCAPTVPCPTATPSPTSSPWSPARTDRLHEVHTPSSSRVDLRRCGVARHRSCVHDASCPAARVADVGEAESRDAVRRRLGVRAEVGRLPLHRVPGR